jgi:hypothetical protein
MIIRQYGGLLFEVRTPSRLRLMGEWPIWVVGVGARAWLYHWEGGQRVEGFKSRGEAAADLREMVKAIEHALSRKGGRV